MPVSATLMWMVSPSESPAPSSRVFGSIVRNTIRFGLSVPSGPCIVNRHINPHAPVVLVATLQVPLIERHHRGRENEHEVTTGVHHRCHTGDRHVGEWGKRERTRQRSLHFIRSPPPE